MDRRIRILGLFLVLCFGLLIVQLDNLQVRKATALDNGCCQPTTSANPFKLPRGEILTADGIVLAYTAPSKDSDEEQRFYPKGEEYTDVTGYYDVVDTADPYGMEAEYNDYLEQHPIETASGLKGLLTQQNGTDSVVTTVVSALQNTAENALAPYQAGAIVAIVPKTGAILAFVGKPTFDPNLFASHDRAAVEKTYATLARDPDQPLDTFPTQYLAHPGSTFKAITTAAIFDHDPSLALMDWPVVSSVSLPETDQLLRNFQSEPCGGNLAEVLAKSCDTAYGKIGIKLGANRLAAEAKSFGLNSPPPIDLPESEVSSGCFPPVGIAPNTNPDCPAGVTPIDEQDQPQIAYSAIGQENVSESALEDAMVAAAMGDGGTMMTPHLMDHIVDETGRVVKHYVPTVWRQATSAATADQVRSLMLGVALDGTAVGVFPPNLHVAAKTGTAEVGTNNCSTNWMIATAPAGPGDTPGIAVAVVVPYQPGTACDGTGAEIAGPIAAKVLEAYFAKAG